jgi:TetR/AcrR family transcriptional regulator, mexJK operon transcriptional repressor
VLCKLWLCDLALKHLELVAQNYDFDLLSVCGAKSKDDELEDPAQRPVEQRQDDEVACLWLHRQRMLRHRSSSEEGWSEANSSFRHPQGRSGRKRRAILEAGRTVFMRKGYGGASMDEVASVAKVSKQTVYKHFADKENLFTEIITSDMERRSQELVHALTESEGAAVDLRQLARRHIASIVKPEVMRMRRMVIGEADRFPKLAQAWAERGIGSGLSKLAERFTELADRGLLRVDDPSLAAQHFNWLVLSIPLNASMFDTRAKFTRAQLEHHADEGVRVFLAAYGTPPFQGNLTWVPAVPRGRRPVRLAAPSRQVRASPCRPPPSSAPAGFS